MPDRLTDERLKKLHELHYGYACEVAAEISAADARYTVMAIVELIELRKEREKELADLKAFLDGTELRRFREENERLEAKLASTEAALDAYAKRLADSEELLLLNEEQDEDA